MSVDQLARDIEIADDAVAVDAPTPREEPVSVPMVTAAAFFAASAAGWALGGLFGGALARIAAVSAAALGAGITGFGSRARRATLWQATALPVVVLVGVALALLGGGAEGGVIGSVVDSVRGGGPSGSALPFDAGWRVLVVVLIGTLAAGACSLAIATRRSRLTVALCVPVMIAATLVQPQGSMLSTGLPSMALLLGALVAAYGVELAADGAVTGGFEIRRIINGVIGIAAVAAVLVASSRAGFLFPVPDREHVIPPQLPPVARPTPDRELFTVRAGFPGPWRFGVLDVYDGTAWRLPPYDPSRFRALDQGGRVPDVAHVPAGARTVTFTIRALSGPVLPAPPGASVVRGARPLIDPRSQILRLKDGHEPSAGVTYTVSAAPAPTGKQLSDAPRPRGQAEFLSAPRPPASVTSLLADAPTTSSWDRLQFMRTALYRAAVAAGAGQAKAVPPARVAQILAGKPASPYELTAAEALIARWAGVPSRIGYGFYDGDPKGAVRSVRPRHASTWLEVYFEGHGWVPVVGVPPRARASLDQRTSDANPRIRPTEQLALVLYVPVRLETIQLLYSVARYWIAIALPFVVAALLAWIFSPGLFKMLRRLRRRRWARALGVRARIAVAYADLRDRAIDLNVGDPSDSLFGFVAAVVPDDELVELTWLVSRALWGDLQRDLRAGDADAAEALAASVTKRLHRAQPSPTRVLAVASRASLRAPYTNEIPNLWPGRRRARRVIVISASVLALVLASCAPDVTQSPSGRGSMPGAIVPDTLGDTAFRREPAVEARLSEAGDGALIDAARVYTFKQDGIVQGYLQVGAFKPGATADRRDVRRGVLAGLGATFTLARVGSLRVYVGRSDTRQLVVWFAPDGSYFELLVARANVEDPTALLARILGSQGTKVGRRGAPVKTLTPPDPRRGEVL